MNEEQIRLFNEILGRVQETVTGRKNDDYNAGGVKWEDYNRRGASSILDMIWRKVLRLCSLEAVGFKARCESAIDTIVDLIAYAGFLYVHLKTK